jgi:hypothetical protein
VASAQGTSGGIRAGFNLAKITIDFDEAKVTGDGRAGLVAGGFVAQDFNATFGIQVEGLFSQKGTEFAEQSGVFDEDASLKLNYLDFPVLARISFPGSAAAFRVLTGPSFNFKISQSAEVGNVELDADELPLKPFEFAYVLGAAVEVGRFIIDGRYNWGLTDINDEEEDDEPTVKNNWFSVSFGWRF